jgi:hypothetical protein
MIVIAGNVVEIVSIDDSSQMQGKKLLLLSLELQVTFIRASISKVLVA